MFAVDAWQLDIVRELLKIPRVDVGKENFFAFEILKSAIENGGQGIKDILGTVKNK